MSNRIDNLLVSDGTHDKNYTAAQVIAAIEGGGGGGGSTARTTMTATYSTLTVSPTVYYTALNTDGSVLTARSTSGVIFANGLWQRIQSTVGVTDFIAVWDEGDVNDYASEWITVDT